jgi:hypothetical protein
MTITTTFVTVLRRFEYLAEKVMYSNHYNIEKNRFEMYKDCLFNNKETRELVCNIISKKLKLYSVVVDKVAI